MFQNKLQIYYFLVVGYVKFAVQNSKARSAVIQPTRINKHDRPSEVKIITTNRSLNTETLLVTRRNANACLVTLLAAALVPENTKGFWRNRGAHVTRLEYK